MTVVNRTDGMRQVEPTVFGRRYAPERHLPLAAAAFVGATALVVIFSLGAVAAAGQSINGFSQGVKVLTLGGVIVIEVAIGSVAFYAFYRGCKHYAYYTSPRNLNNEMPSAPLPGPSVPVITPQEAPSLVIGSPLLEQSSSSQTAPHSLAQDLYGDVVRHIMSYLEVPDLLSAESTCRSWMREASPSNVHQSPWKMVFQREFMQMYKQRHTMYAPYHVRKALASTSKNFSDRLAAAEANFFGGNDNDIILDLIEEYIGSPEEIPPMAPFRRNPRQMYMEPYFGERAIRLAGIDPGPVLPLASHLTQIPNTAHLFGSQVWIMYFPETLNGETPCLDTLEKINHNITGSNSNVFDNKLTSLTEKEIAYIRRKPLELSGWYYVSVVGKTRGKVFAGVDGKKEFVEINGRGQWQIASICQVMFMVILFRALGKSLLNDDSATSFEKENGYPIEISERHGREHALRVCLMSNDYYSIVVALRKLPAS